MRTKSKWALILCLAVLTQYSFAQNIQNIVPPSTDNAAMYVVTTYDLGTFPHPDRDQRIITEMPEELRGMEGLKTSHVDRGSTQNPFLSFDILNDSEVFVAWDSRCTEATWLADQGWDNTGGLIHVPQDTDAPTRQVWRRVFSAGTVQLPPPECGGRSNYFVLVNSLEEPPAPEPLVWNFCDGLQGWAMANQSPVAWDGSRMVVTQSATAPTTYDPHIQAAGLDHDLVAFPHLAMKFTVENAPRPFTIGFFSWRDTGGFFRPQVTNIGNGEHLIRIDYAAQFSGTDEWGARLTALRMDIPDNEPHVDGGAWPDFQDMVVTIDWIAFSDDPDFEPGPCPVVVNISGPSMVVQGNDVILWADVTGNVGDVSYQWWKNGQELPGETNSFLELTAVTMQQSGLYAVAVTDDNDTVIVTHNLMVVEALPVSNAKTIALLCLVLFTFGVLFTVRKKLFTSA